MEKNAKPKNKILKLLPKAASAVVMFQNPPFSPGRDNASKLKTHVSKGFSGPIVSIIPREARRKPKNESFETQEPTSPKVSCMGQIKHKKKITKKTKRVSPPHQDVNNPVLSSPGAVKKHATKIKRMFSSGKLGKKSNTAPANDDSPSAPSERAPTLSQMKRFESGRDTLANFDWTAQIAPEASEHRTYYSDEERRDSDGEEEEEEDDHREVIIPFSAPIIPGGERVALQPKKEINLWKRRTMNPPRPLQLNPTVRAG